VSHFPGGGIVWVGLQWFYELVIRLCGLGGFKHVPDELFQSPRPVVVSFLAGLFDSNGDALPSGLEFRDSNGWLISRVADLLAMLGVRVTFKEQQKSFYGASHTVYCLHIWDKIEGLEMRRAERLVESGSHSESVLPETLPGENGFEHLDYIPVSILKVEPCHLIAYIMECSTHEFIGMGQRSHNCNFGLLYEIENPEWVLANLTEWPIEQCREFMAKYKSALGRLYAWKDKVILEGRTTGSIKNLYGFERRVYGYFHTSDRYLHKLGDRTCANQNIQGLAAIMMRIILVKCWKMFNLPQGKYYGSGVRVFAPIHDEFDLFVPDASILPELLPDFGELMESVTPPSWPVKLRAEIEVGDNMGETFVVGRDASSGLWLPKTEERPVADDVAPALDSGFNPIDEWVEDSVEALEEAQGFSF
jgi:hypothetical protein